jgi:hypothetical protein
MNARKDGRDREPQTLEDYEHVFKLNTKYEGFGLNTALRLPCPFCADVGPRAILIVEMDIQSQKPSLCSSCGRSWKALINREAGSVRSEFVQVGGPTPAGFVPKMRRVS